MYFVVHPSFFYYSSSLRTPSKFKVQGSMEGGGLCHPDTMVKDGGALTHVPHGHPELVSGSEEPNRQMLNQRSTPEGAKVKQVQHDKMMEGEKNKSASSASSASENHAVSVILN